MSANDKCNNYVKSGAAHRSPGIYFEVEENPGKPQLGDRLMKVVRKNHRLNEIPYLQMTSAGSHSRSGRERKEGKESMGEVCLLP